MDYIESYSHDPQWNLALEQYVFDEMDRSRSYVMLWQNHNTIVVGKNQNTVNEVNSDYVRRHGITVVRRLSGGGAVYHDLGNLNFTFITDADDSQRIDLHMFCIPIVETLRSFGVTAQISGRNDITVDGKKFSGNSQYVREHRVMHHGTILFDSDLSVVSEALSVDRDKLTAKGIASVRSRVTNLRPYLPQGTSLDDFKRRLLEYLSVESPVIPHPLTAEDEKRIAEIRAERYATWEWNYGCSRSIQTCAAAGSTAVGRSRSVCWWRRVRSGTSDFTATSSARPTCPACAGRWSAVPAAWSRWRAAWRRSRWRSISITSPRGSWRS